MQRRLLLDVVVRQCSTVLQLFSGEYQTLLVWGNAFLVLDFLFHVLDGIARFDIKGDRFPCQSLDENLHGSCFDVCVARGGCGRMKPASSNFSAPRTHNFDLIGGTGAGTTDSTRDFLLGIFRRVAPKPKRPNRTAP